MDIDIWMSNIISGVCDLLLFPILLKLLVLIRLLTKDYSNVKLCCELNMVILQVSTFFFLRHQVVSLSRANELDVQFMKTISNNINACEYGVYLTLVTRGQYHTVRPANDTIYRPLLDIKPLGQWNPYHYKFSDCFCMVSTQ